MVYFDDTLHDTVSKTVVTHFEFDLYVNNFSHSKNLVVHITNLLWGKLYFYDIVSDTMVTKLPFELTYFYVIWLLLQTYELTSVSWPF